MPFSHALILCIAYTFGSVIVGNLMSMGIIEYPFYVKVEPGRVEVNFAVMQSVVFTAFVVGGQSLMGSKPRLKSRIIDISIAKISGLQNLASIFIIAYAVFLTAYYWDDMSAREAARHAGNEFIPRISLILVLLLGLAHQKARYLRRFFVSVILIYFGTIYASIGASRSAAIPFIFVAALFFSKGNILTSTISMYLGLVALATAFAARGNPSYSNYWETFFSSALSFDVGYLSLVVLQYSFPGLTTIQAALFDPGEFSLTSIFRFLAYLLPVPSSWLPSNLFENSSLSAALGIDRSILGINQDIYSESIAWFGSTGAWFYTLTVSLLVLLPYWIASRVLKSTDGGVYVVCLIANIYMILGGQVFTLRAGSRAVLIVSILMALVYLSRRIKFKSRRV